MSRGCIHNDVIKLKHFPCYWSFLGWIHQWPVNSPHKGQWRGALMLSLICASNDWVNNGEAGDLIRHCAHYDVNVMFNTFVTVLPLQLPEINAKCDHRWQQAGIGSGNVCVTRSNTITWTSIHETILSTGVGVTIAPFVNLSASKIFDLASTLDYWI